MPLSISVAALQVKWAQYPLLEGHVSHFVVFCQPVLKGVCCRWKHFCGQLLYYLLPQAYKTSCISRFVPFFVTSYSPIFFLRSHFLSGFIVLQAHFEVKKYSRRNSFLLTWTSSLSWLTVWWHKSYRGVTKGASLYPISLLGSLNCWLTYKSGGA